MSRFKITSDFIVNSLCAITIGTGVAEYSTNVLFNKTYVKYLKESYKNNLPISLSESLRKQYDDILQDLKYTDFQKAFITPFVAEGLNPVGVGCLNTRTGCFIGIPNIYNHNKNDETSVLDDAKSELHEYIQFINENSESGQSFMKSLVLSDSAKKFSIAREIVLTDNFRIFLKSISFSITLLPMYILGEYVMSSLPANPVKVKTLAFFFLCNLGIFVWLFVRNIIEKFYQNEADKVVGSINEEYTRGGIEYYEKLIQRHVALRSIIPDGKTIYSERGDQVALLSVLTELSIVYRKKQLEHKLKEYVKINDEKEQLQ